MFNLCSAQSLNVVQLFTKATVVTVQNILELFSVVTVHQKQPFPRPFPEPTLHRTSAYSNRSSIRKRGAAHKVIVSQLRPHMGSPYGYLGSTAHGFCPNVTFRTYEYDAFE